MQQTLRGATIHWREAGAGDPLIFIHGFPFDCTMWEPQLAAVPEGWRFIAPDLRGFGESTAPKNGPLSMDEHADDVVALLDHLGIDQAVICGLSMGGYIALSLARRHADRVRALVLVATRAGADTEKAKKDRYTLAQQVRTSGIQVVLDSMLPKVVSAHTRMKSPEVVEKVRAMMERTTPDTMARALEGMAERKDYTSELDRIDVSTMIVRGEQDEIIASGDMELIARCVRGSRHEMIAFVSHLPNLEAPDVFNSTLFNYLKYLPPALKLGDMTLSF